MMTFEEDVAETLNSAFKQYLENPAPPSYDETPLKDVMQQVFEAKWPDVKLLDVYLSDDESEIVIEYDTVVKDNDTDATD